MSAAAISSRDTPLESSMPSARCSCDTHESGRGRIRKELPFSVGVSRRLVRDARKHDQGPAHAATERTHARTSMASRFLSAPP
eukprot:scaffold151260_cov19-Tisochrysis_lutea.AAC.1